MADEEPVKLPVVKAKKAAKPLKSGLKTTEFWVALLLCGVGVWLITRGHDEIGGLLIAASGLGYKVSRGMAKKGAALVLACLLIGGCAERLGANHCGCQAGSKACEMPCTSCCDTAPAKTCTVTVDPSARCR